MARYRPLSDELYELDTSAGPMPVQATEEELLANGHEPDVPKPDLGPDLRLAQNKFGLPEGVDTSLGGDGMQLDRELADVVGRTDLAPQPPPREPEGSSSPLSKIFGDGKPQTKKAKGGGSGGKTNVADKFAPGTEEIDLQSYLNQLRAQQGTSAPQFGRTKARDVKAQWSVRKGHPVSEDSLEAEADASINQQLALLKKGALDAERAETVKAASERAITQREKEVSGDEIRLQKMRGEYARRQNEIDREREAVNKLEVDPEQLFSDGGGTFAKLLAGLSIIAGGMLQGLRGLKSNPGLDAVNEALDRNIANQREKIANKREGVDSKETALEKLMAIYGNPEVAERELRNRQMALFEAYARDATIDSSEDVQANVNATLADWQRQRVTEQRAIDQQAQDDVQEQWIHQQAQTYQIGGGSGITDKNRGRIVTVEGVDLWARTDAQAKDAQEKIANSDVITQNLARIRALAKDASGLTPGTAAFSETRSRIKALAEATAPRISVAAGQGAMTDDEAARKMKTLGDPESIIRGQANEMLDETIRDQHSFRKSTVGNYLYRDENTTQHAIRPGPKSAEYDR